MSKSGKQFSLTRAASINGGATKKQFPVSFILLFISWPLVNGCAPQADSTTDETLKLRIAALEKQITDQEKKSFKPELGDIMLAIQMRHSKLWFAGENNNWPLAAFELHELDEAFDEVVKFHPTHEKVPTPLPNLITAFIRYPVTQLEQTIKDKNREDFRAAFAGLSTSCNTCHQTTGYPFIVIKQPGVPPVGNQEFTPLGVTP